jgi:Domain of unknown function (DUF4399)
MKKQNPDLNRTTFTITGLAIGISIAAILMACGKKQDKKVYFSNLENYSHVESPFKVQMKAENLIVEPASMGIRDGAGHFHIIIDAPLSPPGAPIPKSETHIHYGNGETETILDLPVGEHTLILQFAKGDHIPYEPPIAQQIQITVTKQNKVDTTAAMPMDSTAAAMADSAKAMVDSTKAMADSAKATSMDSSKTTVVDTSKKAAPKAAAKTK